MITDTKLDLLLAEKIMGYELPPTPVLQANEPKKFIAFGVDGNLYRSEWTLRSNLWAGDKAYKYDYQERWSPTTNLVHAFEVVAELTKKPNDDNEPMLYFYLSIIPDDGQVIAKFESYTPEMRTCEGWDGSVPMAISLAAEKVVKWREGNK